MKRILFGMAALAGAGALAATVSNVSVSPAGAGTGPVEVTYDLDERAIVTFDVLTNGVSIGQGAANAGGDANRCVQAGAGRRIFWMPHRDWEGHGLSGVQVQVKAWSLDAPPPYLATRLLSAIPDVRYYASADLVPGGVTSRTYKTTHLLMAKIPAKDTVATLGSATGYASTPARELMRRVKMSADFYMGVYEFTQGQFSTATNATNASESKGQPDADCRPLTNWSCSQMRGQDILTGDAPTETSLLGVLRARTGLALDQPDCTQWEFACRAGQPYNVNVAGAALADVAWYSGNRTDKYAQPVGQLLPNAFGLYDMQGNVLELTLERYPNSEAETKATFGEQVGTDADGQPIYGDANPKGVAVSSRQMARMGGCHTEATGDNNKNYSPGRRAAGNSFTSSGGDVGFRLVCPAANGGLIR